MIFGFIAAVNDCITQQTWISDVRFTLFNWSQDVNIRHYILYTFHKTRYDYRLYEMVWWNTAETMVLLQSPLHTFNVVTFSSGEHCLSIDSVQCSLEQSLLVHWNCEELEISNCTIMWVTHNLFLKRCDHLDRRPNCLSWVAKRV